MNGSLLTAVGLLSLAALAASLPATGAEAPFPDSRVDEITGWLPEQPTGFGRPLADRSAWQELVKRPEWQRLLPKANNLLAQPIPALTDELYLDFSRTGNRTRWQRVNSQRQDRFQTLVLAECLENKGRFLAAIADMIAAFASEKTWTYPAHDRSLDCFYGKRIDIDLNAATLGFILATADHLLGDLLSSAARRQLRDEVQRRVFTPFRDMVEGRQRPIWWMHGTNNWNAVCLAGVTGAAQALLSERRQRAWFIAAAEHYSTYFLKGFTPGGYCTEGLGYWGYGFGDYLILTEVIYQATDGKLDLLMRPAAREPALFGARAEIRDGVYPAFADCSIRARPGVRQMWYISHRLGLGLSDWEQRDPSGPGGRLYEAMMHTFPVSTRRAPGQHLPVTNIGLRTWFADVGILISRPADPQTTRLAAAFKGGHNGEHHNHNDVGSYVIVVGGSAVLLDPGGEVYTARTFSPRRYESKLLNSWGHPVPVVAGKLQSKGAKGRANVVRADFTGERDVLTLDLKPAYDVPSLQRLQRTFVYQRKPPGLVQVIDEVAFASPQTFGSALITYGRHRRQDDGSLIVYANAEAVRVRIEADGGDIAVHPEEIDEDASAGGHPLRLGLDFAAPVRKARLQLTITPTDFGGDGRGLKNGHFEHETWAWDVRRGGMGEVSADRAASGSHSLHITDDSKTRGSSITSARVAVDAAKPYELRGKYFGVSGEGVGMYVRMLDAHGTVLNTDGRGWMNSVGSLGGTDRRWRTFAFPVKLHPQTRFVQVWIHSYNAALVEGYLDDIGLVATE